MVKNRLAYLDIYFGNALSVKSTTISNKFNIYPNPAINKINVISTGELNNKNYKIFNSIGQLVGKGNIENEQIKINRLDKGLYFIIIDGASSKLIKN